MLFLSLCIYNTSGRKKELFGGKFYTHHNCNGSGTWPVRLGPLVCKALLRMGGCECLACLLRISLGEHKHFLTVFWSLFSGQATGTGQRGCFCYNFAAIQHLWITCKWYAYKSHTRVSLNRVVLTIIQFRVCEITRLWPWPTNIKKSHTRKLFPILKLQVPQNRICKKWLCTELSSSKKFRVCDFKNIAHAKMSSLLIKNTCIHFRMSDLRGTVHKTIALLKCSTGGWKWQMNLLSNPTFVWKQQEI